MGGHVTSGLLEERFFDRLVGVCRADGIAIRAAVIEAGYAIDCEQYSGDH